MRNDLLVDAFIWRMLGKGTPNCGGELAERFSWLGSQPQYVLTEPIRVRKSAVKGTDSHHGRSQSPNDSSVDGRRGDKGRQDGNVSRHTPSSRRVEVLTVLTNQRLRLWYRCDDRGFRRNRRIWCGRQIAHPAEGTESPLRVVP